MRVDSPACFIVIGGRPVDDRVDLDQRSALTSRWVYPEDPVDNIVDKNDGPGGTYHDLCMKVEETGDWNARRRGKYAPIVFSETSNKSDTGKATLTSLSLYS